MDIYIEYVVLDNLVINYLILLCVKLSLKLNCKWYHIFVSSIIGTIVACVLPLFNLTSIVQIPIKLALGVVMVLCLSRFYSFKRFIFAFLLFIAYTFLLAGACLITLFTFGTSLEALSSGGYDIAIPLGLILLIISVYVYIIVVLARFLSRKRDLEPFLRKISIVLGEKVLCFNAFLDSGNRLVDSSTGLPVIILSITALEKYFTTEQIESLMLMQGKNSPFKKVHSTGYNTVSGEAKKMVIFEADKLVINQGEGEYITNRFVVGVSYKKFKDATDYDCLLNQMVM